MNITEKLFAAVEQNNIEEVKRLLEAAVTLEELTDGEKEDFSVNIDVQDEDGCTLLMKAVDLENLEMVALLIEQGADVNKINNSGLSPYIAAVNEDSDIAKIIKVANGFKLSDQDKNHLNEILHRRFKNSPFEIESLIEAGADVNSVDAKGENAFDIATRRNLAGWMIRPLINAPNFALSEKNKANLNDLLLNQLKKPKHNIDKDFIAFLIKSGADIHYVGAKGESPFDVATTRIDLDPNIAKQFIKVAIAALPSKNQDQLNELLQREINKPIKNRSQDYFEELLKVGADINAWDAIGNTPLINAIIKDDIDTFNFLVKKTLILTQKTVRKSFLQI